MALTSTHFYCGGGGDTLGLEEAGFTPSTAINHDEASINTHRANFPNVRHLNSNIEQVEMRRLPRTDVLWGSPICTESSPAGGKKRDRKRDRNQLDMFTQDEEPAKDENFERTRVTALGIIAATEVHRYDVVMGENVVEFGLDWPLYDWWIQGMGILGYDYQLINVNAAHISGPDNLSAPQWRDRMFFIFSKRGINMPKLKPRPLAPCLECGTDVNAVQWWKESKTRFGKYRSQYLYRCPNRRCKHAIVEPYVRAAAEILDFNHIGTRIGDRRRPLVPNTRRRVQAGLDALGERQMLLTVNHGGDDIRAFLPHTAPMPTRTAKIGEAVVTPPAFIAELRRNGTYSSVSEPLTTVTSGGNHHALVVPYYSNGTAVTTDRPLSTVTTVDRHALVTGDTLEIDDCYLRMVQPLEQFKSQRFPGSYVLTGTKTQQTAQAGNAVPVNVARWIGEHVYSALDRTSALAGVA